MARTKRGISAAAAQAREAEQDSVELLRHASDPNQPEPARTTDSFQNFLLNLGIGTDNAAFGGSTYGFNPISRIRTLLEWVHRGSWLGGVAVDLIADDMTRAGTEVTEGLDNNQAELIHSEFTNLGIWNALNDGIKWARLYGGALVVLLIDGQDFATPLRIETVGRDQFKGLLVLDRWMVEPTLFSGGIVNEMGPNMGMPKFYKITGFSPVLMNKRVHYTRCIRLEGIRLPYWQRVMENMWGISVLERLYDRMIAFDSATTGAAQLVHKAALRTFKVKNLRQIATTGGDAYQGLLKYVDMMRRFQGIEQVTLIDSEDEFEIEQRGGFAGIPEALIQFGQQLAGALQIPLVRLFGMSPAGFSATGDSDIKTYYDMILHRQKKDLHGGMNIVYRVTARSRGIELDDDFAFGWIPLWQMDDIQKSQVASTTTTAVLEAKEQGVVSAGTALREMHVLSRRTGVWTTIQEEDIRTAEEEPPPMMLGALGGGPPELAGTGRVAQVPGAGQGLAQPGPQREEMGDTVSRGAARAPRRIHLHLVRDTDRLLDFQGLPIYIETRKGEVRRGNGWSVTMPAHYGFVRLSGSPEGPAEGLDCFVGDHQDAPNAFVIEQVHPETGAVDEPKLMLGFKTAKDAVDCYERAFSDCSGSERIGGMKRLAVGKLSGWIEEQGFVAPTAPAA